MTPGEYGSKFYAIVAEAYGQAGGQPPGTAAIDHAFNDAYDIADMLATEAVIAFLRSTPEIPG